ASIDAAGALKVGPRSAGAVPGPACYGLGGTEPAVSDANLILSYLNPERIYGGSIRLDRARAERALEPIQRRFGLSLLDAAHAVRLETWDGKVVADRLRGLEAQCLTPLLDEGHSVERVLLKRSADLRYAGQNYELEVDYGAGTPEALRDVFERRHRQLYGYAT